MYWLHNNKELKTKQDYLDLINEIYAYCKLEGQSFDFGTGLIKNELSYGTEIIYWKNELRDLEYIVNNWNKFKNKNKNTKFKLNKYHKKHIDKIKLNKLQNAIWWGVQDRETHLQRCYPAKNSKRFYKKYSNKIVRKYDGYLNKKGRYHNKLFDLWWTLF